MADCTIRRRDESWIEVVLKTPTYAGELGKAHAIMLGQLGHDNATISNDDVYEVVANEEEIILRAKAPTTHRKVTWADSAVDAALATLLDYRDRNITTIGPDSQALHIAIDTLRAIGADPKGRAGSKRDEGSQ